MYKPLDDIQEKEFTLTYSTLLRALEIRTS